MDTLPPGQIEIVRTVTMPQQRAVVVNIEDAVIEKVARLLCEADGQNPDSDWRARPNSFLTVNVEHPHNLMWNQYREKARDRLKAIFAP